MEDDSSMDNTLVSLNSFFLLILILFSRLFIFGIFLKESKIEALEIKKNLYSLDKTANINLCELHFTSVKWFVICLRQLQARPVNLSSCKWVTQWDWLCVCVCVFSLLLSRNPLFFDPWHIFITLKYYKIL